MLGLGPLEYKAPQPVTIASLLSAGSELAKPIGWTPDPNWMSDDKVKIETSESNPAKLNKGFWSNLFTLYTWPPLPFIVEPTRTEKSPAVLLHDEK